MPETIEADNISITRKKLGFRSWHRGTREMDILLGRFADAHLGDMGAEDLALYDRFLSNSDPDIYNWVSRTEPVPPAEDNRVVALLLAFYPQ